MAKKNNDMKTPNGGYAVKACYTEQFISDYIGNPLIEALPPIFSYDQAEELLHIYPNYSEKERELDAHYRFHCVQRLFRYFQPFDRHFDIEQRISRVIRQGYISRNPFKANYASDLQSIYEAIKQGNYEFDNCDLSQMNASGFTVIGFSGVGKTKAIERVLALYPQIILHSKYKEEDFFHYQLSWLKLDCPYDGSVKGLCINFFMEIDKLLGDNTYDKFASGRNTTTDTMIPRMAQIARRHSLGVLIIDEIQHLSVAKSGGSEKMLNFFVTLVNKIGIPVILVGTTKAISVLQSEFRQARRGSGQQGDIIWENMPKDDNWELLIEGLWQYQWTKKAFSLTNELRDVLYDESQGIIDIVIKLYAMSQMRAIATGDEKITSKLIKKVAEDNLQLVRPMLQALRSGDKKEISRYEDIRPIDIDKFCDEHLATLNKNAIKKARITKPAENVNAEITIIETAIIKLLDLGINQENAKKAVEIVASELKNVDLATIVKDALLIALQDQQNKEELKKRNKKEKMVLDINDLRYIAAESSKQNIMVYEAYVKRGLIKNPVEELIEIG